VVKKFYVILGLFLLPVAYAYTIDGDPGDWAPNLLTGDWSINDTWLPSGSYVNFMVEDNRDPTYSCNSGYCATGVHIYGEGSTYRACKEPIVNRHVQPAGGEQYDIEAIYFDDDWWNAYFLVITSMPEDGVPYGNRHLMPGDLAIDLDKDPNTGEYGYEYGIKLFGNEKGIVCKNPDWELPDQDIGLRDNAPSQFDPTTCQVTGNAEVVWKELGEDDNGKKNYAMEGKVSKLAMGRPPILSFDVHSAVSCGNDAIELKDPDFDYPSVPEFPFPAIAMFFTWIIFILLRRRNF